MNNNPRIEREKCGSLSKLNMEFSDNSILAIYLLIYPAN